MQKRQVKKFVGGKWQECKWADIAKGDTVRIYERGYGVTDGGSNTFVALGYSKLVDGSWQFEYERGVMTDEAQIDVHSNIRKG